MPLARGEARGVRVLHRHGKPDLETVAPGGALARFPTGSRLHAFVRDARVPLLSRRVLPAPRVSLSSERSSRRRAARGGSSPFSRARRGRRVLTVEPFYTNYARSRRWRAKLVAPKRLEDGSTARGRRGSGRARRIHAPFCCATRTTDRHRRHAGIPRVCPASAWSGALPHLGRVVREFVYYAAAGERPPLPARKSCVVSTAYQAVQLVRTPLGCLATGTVTSTRGAADGAWRLSHPHRAVRGRRAAELGADYTAGLLGRVREAPEGSLRGAAPHTRLVPRAAVGRVLLRRAAADRDCDLFAS